MRRLAVLLVAGGLLLAGCGGDDGSGSPPSPSAAPSSPSFTPTRIGSPVPLPSDSPSAPAMESQDSYYPLPGNGGVDAVHYSLQLGWDPHTRKLTGVELLRFNGLGHDARLDLSKALTVSTVELDGRSTSFTHQGGLLEFPLPSKPTGGHNVVIRYSGSPVGPGVHVMDDGELWTAQEPIGAFDWYAVDDQPSDKARYDFDLSVPAPWVGIANGRLDAQNTVQGINETRFHLDQPASSYLTTLAFGAYTMSSGGTVAGTPITYWTPTGDDYAASHIRAAGPDLVWLEQKLGPYPFKTLSLIVEKGFSSAIETQTTITEGDTPYTLQPDTILHEISHQWYGDEVTPGDWVDLWMSEGMAMYLQGTWLGEQRHIGVEGELEGWVADEKAARERAGPPAAYDKNAFADINVYYGPALMWDELRRMVGDDAFWAMVKAWPATHRFQNADRQEYESWISQQLGHDYSGFMNDWLLSKTSPTYTG